MLTKCYESSTMKLHFSERELIIGSRNFDSSYIAPVCNYVDRLSTVMEDSEMQCLYCTLMIYQQGIYK